MPAVIIDADESSTGHTPQSLTEKIDNSRAAPNAAEYSRTNGSGDAREEIEKDESEGDADTEEGESESGEDDAKEESLDVGVAYDHDDDGGEEEDEEEENEEDGDEEDEDIEEEEEEPSLKYERMGGAVNELLKKDSVSALAVSNKCLVCPPSKH
jgi:hypothetical protein